MRGENQKVSENRVVRGLQRRINNENTLKKFSIINCHGKQKLLIVNCKRKDMLQENHAVERVRS
jgi:hypothetical protein